jgi:CRISPR-associated endonuclease Cas2
MGGKRRITLEGVLKLIEDLDVAYFDLSHKAVYRRFYNPKYINLEDYFPSEVENKINILKRKGFVSVVETDNGTEVVLSESGKKQILKYNLNKLENISGKWDGKWRLVFFDIEEKDRRKRADLVFYLGKLGLKEMQESVYIGPYECANEVKYIREVLGIPDGVKLATVINIENEEELKKWFDL